ncbi:unnamed protein product [Heligmosomoides polygyrus]|uniref:Uncharacterized protein n=1 Tax=Heligmosomoides polygyrus TaxID=6339 RepID=A0A183FGI6_HELPZ|nr:unnamed protein product [Heligmosomoides polygyrus]
MLMASNRFIRPRNRDRDEESTAWAGYREDRAWRGEKCEVKNEERLANKSLKALEARFYRAATPLGAGGSGPANTLTAQFATGD